MNCHWISIGNLFWGGNLAITSNPCERQTIWPKSMKFWYKKRQSILFKGKLISNLCLLVSQRKSLTESIIWGGWPCKKGKNGLKTIYYWKGRITWKQSFIEREEWYKNNPLWEREERHENDPLWEREEQHENDLL